MIFKYPDKFMVPVREIKVEKIKDDIRLNDKNQERKLAGIALQNLIGEFKSNEKMWYDIDEYYCEYEAGYI